MHLVDHGLGASLLEDGDHQEDLGILVSLVCLDPFVKLSIVDMLKCTNTHVLCFGIWFLVESVLDFLYTLL